MKKHLIAAAVAAAVAVPAAAQVTVYGVMDIGYTSSKNDLSGPGIAQVANRVEVNTVGTGNGDGGLSTSILGFRGEEDLGGGLKAGFNLEYDLTNIGVGGNTLGARRSFVSLSGAPGRVQFGRDTSAIHGIVTGFSAGFANNIAGAMYSAGNNVTSANATAVRPHGVFTDNMISYTTPNFSGFVGRVDYAKSTSEGVVAGATGTSETSETGLSARYTKGPLDLGIGQQKRRLQGDIGLTATQETAFFMGNGIVDTAVVAATQNGILATLVSGATNMVEARTTALGGSYNFGIAQPFLLHAKTKMADDATTAEQLIDFAELKNTEVGVRVPMGAVTLFASMFNGDFEQIPAPGVADTSGHQIGGTYAMSKRTTLYGIYGVSKVEWDGAGVAANRMDNDTKALSFGIRHSF